MDSKLIGLSIEGYAGLGLIIIVSVYLSIPKPKSLARNPCVYVFMGFGIVAHHRCFVKWIYLVHEMKAKKKKEKKKKKRSFQYKASRLKMVEESLSCLKFSCFQRGWWVCFFYTTAIFQIFIHQYFYQYY